MLTNPFDVNAPSALSIDKINYLNKLAHQAFKNSGHAEREKNDLGCYLQLECFAMEEILEAAGDMYTFTDFFSHVDAAFEMLIKKDPSAFRTYKLLSGMFRTFAKHESIIDAKWNEVRGLLADLDLLENEDLERRKGGENVNR